LIGDSLCPHSPEENEKTPQTFPSFLEYLRTVLALKGLLSPRNHQRALDRSGPFSEIFWLRRERWKVENQKQHQQQTKRRAI